LLLSELSELNGVTPSTQTGAMRAVLSLFLDPTNAAASVEEPSQRLLVAGLRDDLTCISSTAFKIPKV
jgi:hypothetical protein